MEALPAPPGSSQTLVHDAFDGSSPRPVSSKSTIVDGPTPAESQPARVVKVFVSDDEDDDSESDDEIDIYEQPRQDHFDEVVYCSPWRRWAERGGGWPHMFMRTFELSESNEELLKGSDNQRWLRKLSSLQQKNLPSLNVEPKGRPKIPLFRDDASGDEYQVHLSLGLVSGLARINCPNNVVPSPENPDPWRYSADPLCKIRYQLPPNDLDGLSHGTATMPEFVIPLGKLAVRTSLRENWQKLCTETDPPPTEYTDYLVVVDAEREELPVWILVSQAILKDRIEEEGKLYPQLPIFRGLMKDDRYGFDTACIYRSIREIGGQGSAQDVFDEACKLVHDTRSKVNPGVMHVGVEKMEELSGTELPKDWSFFVPGEKVEPEDVNQDVDR